MDTRRTPLHVACDPCHSNIAIVWYLVNDCHFNGEARDKHGSTPLHYAVRCPWKGCQRTFEIVQYLVRERRADIEAIDNDGYNALCHVGDYDLNTIQLFVQECCTGLFTRMSRTNKVNLR